MANDYRSQRPNDSVLDPSRENQRGMERGRLSRLSDLDDYQVAEGDPDVRGWKVKTPDGRNVGEVEHLIADLGALEVRYLEVRLDRDVLRLAQSRNVLAPIETAWLDDDRRVVNLTLTPVDLIAAPPYDPRSFSTLDDETLQRRYAGHLTRSEEELTLHKRRRLGGHVQVRKRVETEHVADLKKERIDVDRK